MPIDDALAAISIIKGRYNKLDEDKVFFDHSFMYRTTNEKINEYASFLDKKKRILSVVSSGDHMFTSIFKDSYNIDSFDISCYPKRYFELRRAAFNVLSREEYIRFFYGEINSSEDFDDMYYSFNKYLEGDDKEFWDYLFNYLDWFDMIHSPLFSHELINVKDILSKNIYLSEDNYYLMKDKVNKANVNFMQGNILELVPKLKYKYSTILLSNIYQYIEFYSYISMLYDLPLYENGQAITYLYRSREEVEKILKDEEIIELSDTAKILVHSGKLNKLYS